MARGGAWAALAAAVLLWWMSAGAGAVWLEIPPSGTKCVAEEIRNNVVVIADYSVLYEHHQVHPTVSVKVTSPFGYTLHTKEKVSADQFAFTTAEAGNFLACFSADGDSKGLVVKLNLDWKIGIAAKDWDSVAKREKLEGVELELVKLDATVQAIHQNLILLRIKESDWLSMMSLSVCILVSVLQLLHLKQYFRKKKLI